MNAPATSFPHADALRHAMRRTAGGVSIVTAGRGAERTGMTVTSALSLSMAPPTMLVAVDRRASSWTVLRDASYFAVNIPAADQVAVAERFAGRGGEKGAERYAGADWQELESGVLGLVGALSVIECSVAERIERLDHVLLIGTVTSVYAGVKSVSPLVYHEGQFMKLVVA